MCLYLSIRKGQDHTGSRTRCRFYAVDSTHKWVSNTLQ